MMNKVLRYLECCNMLWLSIKRSTISLAMLIHQSWVVLSQLACGMSRSKDVGYDVYHGG